MRFCLPRAAAYASATSYACVTLAIGAMLVAAPSFSQTSSLHLIPQPRTVTAASVVALGNGLRIDCASPCDAEDAFAIADLKQTLADRQIAVVTTASAPHILVTRFGTSLGRATYAESLPAGQRSPQPTAMPAEMSAEGYVILPDGEGSRDSGLAVTAQTSAGIFYALQTIKQLIVGSGAAATLQIATIRDWPAMTYRGLHDDLSRGPIDTLEFQKKLIRTLAAYKANLYSPYFETTQLYPSNPLAAVPGASITPAEAEQLVAYARQYHIVIVPEQEAFGHLRHMLTWEQYAGVAETPHGAVLAPGQPGSLTLIDNMFKDLAAMYPGPFLHVGGDETFDLGIGRTRAAVDARGRAAVYLDFMQKIVTDLQPLHRKILFWGDIAQSAPAQLKAMPQSFKDQTIVVQWGYSPQPNGFSNYLKPYADAGFTVWVAPAINNYRQVFPNQREALLDIQGLTRDGQKFGTPGQLNTLWNDDGESLANMNWYGILFGAAAAWQQGESSIDNFKAAYGPVFHGDTTGFVNQAEGEITAAMAELTDAKLGETTDTLFWIDPWSKDGQDFAAKLRPINSSVRLHAEAAINLLGKARLANPTLRESEALDAIDFGARRIDFLCLNFQLSDEMIHDFAQAQSTFAQGNWRNAKPGLNYLFGEINGVNGRLEDMTYGYSSLRDMYQQQWLRTYRPANLRPVLEHFDFTVQLWQSRIDKMRTIQRSWSATHAFDAAPLGIPPSPTPVAPSPNDTAPKP
jgi:hexosaminidase